MSKFKKGIDYLGNTVIILLLLILSSTGVCKYIKHQEAEKGNNVSLNGLSKPLSTVNDGYVCESISSRRCAPAYILVGDIDSVMVEQLGKTLRQRSDDKPICFMSPGGRLDDAVDVVNLMRDHDATACLGGAYFVDGRYLYFEGTKGNTDTEATGAPCLSSCSIIFQALENKVMYGYAFVGVHSAKRIIDLCWCTLPSPLADKALLDNSDAQKIITGTGGEEYKSLIRNFYTFTDTIPNETIYFLTDDELTRYGMPISTIPEHLLVNISPEDTPPSLSE